MFTFRPRALLSAGAIFSSASLSQSSLPMGLYIWMVMFGTFSVSSALCGTGYASGEPPKYGGLAVPLEPMVVPEVDPPGSIPAICLTLARPATIAAAAAAGARAGPTTGIGAGAAEGA